MRFAGPGSRIWGLTFKDFFAESVWFKGMSGLGCTNGFWVHKGSRGQRKGWVYEGIRVFQGSIEGLGFKICERFRE